MMQVCALLAVSLGAVSPWLLGRRVVLRRLRLLSRPSTALGTQVRALPVPVVLELLSAALKTGAGVPRALDAVAAAIGGDDSAELCQVANALRLGASWTSAWSVVSSRLVLVGQALRPAWDNGAPPIESLSTAGVEYNRRLRDAGRQAAGRLGVRLVLPLGTCYLPAFVLIGLAPVLIALGEGLFG